MAVVNLLSSASSVCITRGKVYDRVLKTNDVNLPSFSYTYCDYDPLKLDDFSSSFDGFSSADC